MSMVTLGMCAVEESTMRTSTVMESSWLTTWLLSSSTSSFWPMASFTRVSSAPTVTLTAPFSVFCSATLPLSPRFSRLKARRNMPIDHTAITPRRM